MTDSLTLLPLADTPNYVRGLHGLTATSICGTLKYHIRNPSALAVLRVAFAGHARLLPHPTHAPLDVGGSRVEPLVLLYDTIYDAEDEDAVLDGGSVELPFDIPISSDLPASIELTYGAVDYHIVAEAIYKKGDVVYSEDVPIELTRFTLGAAEALRMDPAVWRADTSHGAAAKVIVTFPEHVVSPGDVVPVHASIEPVKDARLASATIELHEVKYYRYALPGKPLVRRSIVSKTVYKHPEDKPSTDLKWELSLPSDARTLSPSADSGVFCVAHRFRVILKFSNVDSKKRELRLVQACILSLLNRPSREELLLVVTSWELEAAKAAVRRLWEWSSRAMLLTEGAVHIIDPALEEDAEEPVEESGPPAIMQMGSMSSFPMKEAIGADAISVFRVEPLPGRISLIKGYLGLTSVAITGRVRLELIQPICARRLVLHFYGEQVLEAEDMDGAIPGRRGVRRQILYIKEELWRGQGDLPNLQGRDKIFTFDVTLPDGIPESAVHPHARIQYRVVAELAQVTASGIVKRTASFPVELVRCRLTSSPGARQVTEWLSDAAVERRRKVRFKIRVPRRVYAPGDTVRIDLLDAKSLSPPSQIVGCRAEVIESMVYKYARPKLLRRVIAQAEVALDNYHGATIKFKWPATANVSLISASTGGNSGRRDRYSLLLEIRHRLVIRLRVMDGIDLEFSVPIASTSVPSEAADKIAKMVSKEELDNADGELERALIEGKSSKRVGVEVVRERLAKGMSKMFGQRSSLLKSISNLNMSDEE